MKERLYTMNPQLQTELENDFVSLKKVLKWVVNIRKKLIEIKLNLLQNYQKNCHTQPNVEAELNLKPVEAFKAKKKSKYSKSRSKLIKCWSANNFRTQKRRQRMKNELAYLTNRTNAIINDTIM